MSSRLLFKLPCEATLEEAYDINFDAMRMMVATGIAVYVTDKLPAPRVYIGSGAVSEQGPYIIAVKEYRPAELAELILKQPAITSREQL